jgi:hypothetical protein
MVDIPVGSAQYPHIPASAPVRGETLFRMTRPSTARVSCGPCWPSLYCSRLCEHTTHSLTLSYGIALTLLLQHTIASCHIQWLYLAVHGCKTYLNLNLNLSG